jgi:hypothetical protein
MALNVDFAQSLRLPQLGVKPTCSEHRQSVAIDPERALMPPRLVTAMSTVRALQGTKSGGSPSVSAPTARPL